LINYKVQYGRDEIERQAIENEIDELKMVLDLVSTKL
jgi:hypothetical protein